MPYDASKNPYVGQTSTAVSTASRAVTVTPHNTNDLAIYAKALRINGAGTVCFLPVGNADGQTITIDAAAGEYVQIQVRRVLTSGTTATGIVALFD